MDVPRSPLAPQERLPQGRPALQMIAYYVARHRRCSWRDPCGVFSRAAKSTLLVVLLMAVSPQTSRPQDLSEFVEWPDGVFATPTSPIVACIVGDTLMTDLLTDIVAGKQVNGRAVSIDRLKPTDDLSHCHLVFISAAAARHTAAILANLKKTNTLTVGETPGFAKAGGMINYPCRSEDQFKADRGLPPFLVRVRGEGQLTCNPSP